MSQHFSSLHEHCLCPFLYLFSDLVHPLKDEPSTYVSSSVRNRILHLKTQASFLLSFDIPFWQTFWKDAFYRLCLIAMASVSTGLILCPLLPLVLRHASSFLGVHVDCFICESFKGLMHFFLETWFLCLLFCFVLFCFCFCLFSPNT